MGNGMPTGPHFPKLKCIRVKITYSTTLRQSPQEYACSLAIGHAKVPIKNKESFSHQEIHLQHPPDWTNPNPWARSTDPRSSTRSKGCLEEPCCCCEGGGIPMTHGLSDVLGDFP